MSNENEVKKEEEKSEEKKEVQEEGDTKDDISFGFEENKIITRTVITETSKPFDITFKIPNPLENLNLSLDIQAAETGKAEIMVKFISQHIKSWSLDCEPNIKNLSIPSNPNILVVMTNLISNSEKEESGKRKNS